MTLRDRFIEENHGKSASDENHRRRHQHLDRELKELVACYERYYPWNPLGDTSIVELIRFSELQAAAGGRR